MTTLYVIRHAEAEGNLYRRIQGWYDSLITDNGYRQIDALEERFRTVHVDAVYSSDLFRTRMTAGAIYRPKGLPLHPRRDLRELSMGKWRDRTWGEVLRFDRETYEHYHACDPLWKNEGGESWQEGRDRVRGAVLDIAAHHPDETVAVVAHGDIITCLQAEAVGCTVEEMTGLGHCDNTGVTCIEVEQGRMKLLYANDSSHLSDELSTLRRQQWWREQEGPKRDVNAWFRPLDPERDGPFCRALRRSVWEELCGAGSCCDEEAFWHRAVREARQDPEAVWCVMAEDRTVGLLQLDLSRYAGDGAGYIEFMAVDRGERGAGLGPQLLGQAVSVFRSRGRDRLRLLCSPVNRAARAFYDRHGFRPVGTGPGHAGALDLLEKYIGFDEELWRRSRKR